MGFWNYIGLSSKKDNEQLHEEIKLLKQTIEIQSKNQNQVVETIIKELLQTVSQQNKQILSLLNIQSTEINNIYSYVTEQISNIEKSSNESVNTQAKELKLQRKEIQKINISTQQLEKLNAEILKSMQAVWLVQLSQQVENDLIK